jgi:hypothetical protein
MMTKTEINKIIKKHYGDKKPKISLKEITENCEQFFFKVIRYRVSPRLIESILAFRDAINIPIIIIDISKKSHGGQTHPQGIAWDFYFKPGIPMPEVDHLRNTAKKCGFRGCGLYWNGQINSIHLDCREQDEMTNWFGVKDRVGLPWQYVNEWYLLKYSKCNAV